MDINRYMAKAKTLRTKEWVTGYYYKTVETTHCSIGKFSNSDTSLHITCDNDRLGTAYGV